MSERVSNPQNFGEYIFSDTVAKWRMKIINSVLVNGLKPSLMLENEDNGFFGSSDTSENSSIDGCLLWPRSQTPYDMYRRDMKTALYSNSFSILPVIAERPATQTYHAKKDFVSDRICSSFLVVCKEDDVPHLKIDEKDSDEEFYGQTESLITPDIFSYVLLPEDIYSEYKAVNNGPPENVDIKVVRNRLRKRIGIEKSIALVPDYQTVLHELVNELHSPIWIHGVRLPTNDDLVHFLSCMVQ